MSEHKAKTVTLLAIIVWLNLYYIYTDKMLILHPIIFCIIFIILRVTYFILKKMNKLKPSKWKILRDKKAKTMIVLGSGGKRIFNFPYKYLIMFNLLTQVITVH